MSILAASPKPLPRRRATRAREVYRNRRRSPPSASCRAANGSVSTPHDACARSTSSGRRRTQGTRSRAAHASRDSLPVVPMEHQYLITNDLQELAAFGQEIPHTVDISMELVYLRQEGNGVLAGRNLRAGLQTTGRLMVRHRILASNSCCLILEAHRGAAREKCWRAHAGHVACRGRWRVVTGVAWFFSPDGNPIIGPLPGNPTAFVAAGLHDGPVAKAAESAWLWRVGSSLEGEPGMGCVRDGRDTLWRFCQFGLGARQDARKLSAAVHPALLE